MLVLCERPQSYQNLKELMFEGVWDKLEAKSVSRDNHSQNIDVNFSFHVKQCTTGNV